MLERRNCMAVIKMHVENFEISELCALLPLPPLLAPTTLLCNTFSPPSTPYLFCFAMMMTGLIWVLGAVVGVVHGEPACHIAEGCTPGVEPAGDISDAFSREDLDFEPHSPKALRQWLHSQRSQVPTFCPSDAQLHDEQHYQHPISVLKDPVKCLTDQETNWSGKLDDHGLPKGGSSGMLQKMKMSPYSGDTHRIGTESGERRCLDLNDGFHTFSGRFVAKGKLASGRGQTEFEYDGASLVGNIKDGSHQGRTWIFAGDSSKTLQFSGVFSGGRAHGPAWIFPPSEGQVIFLRFRRGRVDPLSVVSLDADMKHGWIGKLVNDSLLVDAERVEITGIGEDSCVRVIKIRRMDDEKKKPLVRLPVLIKSLEGTGQILVRSAKTLIFNRLAKTGSQALSELLVQLSERNGFKTNVLLHRVEHLMEPPEIVAQFVQKVESEMMPTAWVKHYNFVNFEEFGGQWMPQYINIVRDPIERVISWFYYWRAAWNVVERKLAYPDEPLPDPEDLKKDFDTCVLSGDPECQYVEGSNVLHFTDHRSQVMAFCGHAPFCAEFNSAQALQRAKENVEKHYTVVGVLEHLNKSLEVFEFSLPEVFKGATELYHVSDRIRKRKIRNAHKLPVAPEVMEKVRANFTREIEFYNFVRQRLDAQYQRIKDELR